jgi:NTP pyrophosphatase (non-canonical NTP hydrolase)
MTAPSVREQLAALVGERDWGQFHTPPNLAKSISIDAAELLELFQWSDDANEARVRDELADVLTYCHLLAYRLGTEPEELILEKLAVTRSKYPAEKSRGRSTKYTEL